jgi:hypothetical protein
LCYLYFLELKNKVSLCVRIVFRFLKTFARVKIRENYKENDVGQKKNLNVGKNDSAGNNGFNNAFNI